MKVSLISYTPNAARLLVYTKNTRLTLGKELRDKIDAMSEEELNKELDYMANTIPSSWEFVDYVFEITGVTRAFTHQFVRNRHGSYAQQTMRVLDVGGFDYLTGPSINTPEKHYLYEQEMKHIDDTYKALIKSGVAIEDARGVLPTNILTNIIAKFNLRTLSELAKSRTGGRTQGEYRDVMDAMVNAVLAVHPWAEKFMFPKGRDAFAPIEKALAQLKEHGDIALATEALKAVDQLRKQP